MYDASFSPMTQGSRPNAVTLEQLRQVKRFADLPEKTLQWIIDKAEMRTFPKGATIVSQGDVGKYVFTVLEGRVQIAQLDKHGKKSTVEVLSARDSFSEISLNDDIIYRMSAFALTDCTVFTLERSDFVTLIQMSPEIAIQMIKDISKRLLNCMGKVQEVGGEDVESRLAKSVLDLADEKGTESEYLTIPFTRQEMASIIHARTETVIRIVSRWIKSGAALKVQPGLKVSRAAIEKILRKQDH